MNTDLISASRGDGTVIRLGDLVCPARAKGERPPAYRVHEFIDYPWGVSVQATHVCPVRGEPLSGGVAGQSADGWVPYPHG